MPAWREVRQAFLGVDWTQAVVPWDPYLIWMDISGQLPTLDHMSQALQQIAVLVEADRSRLGRLQSLQGRLRNLSIWPTHDMWTQLWAEDGDIRFASVQVNPENVVNLLKTLLDPRYGVTRLMLSKSRQYARDAAPDDFRNKKLERRWLDNIFKALPRFDLLATPRGPAPAASRDGSTKQLDRARQVAVAVIDDRCNFAAWPAGVVGLLWDQSPSPATPQASTRQIKEDVPPARGFQDRFRPDQTPRRGAGVQARLSYGRERRFPPTARGAAALGTSPAPLAVDQDEEYRASRYFTPLRRWSHGSGVLSQLAEGDDAPRGIHFVQLPTTTVSDTSGGSLATHALDGVLDAVAEAASQGATHVIVNLSFGTHSGPHDGTSMFERALLQVLDFFDGRPGRPELHVVVPAGNSHRWRCHRSAHLRPGGQVEMLWRVLPDNPDPAFVEMWLPDGGEHVTVKVTPPAGPAVEVHAGEIRRWQTGNAPEQVVRGAVVFGKSVTQGQRGTMVLVALAPTSPLSYVSAEDLDARATTNGGLRIGSAAHGVWTIELSLAPGAQGLRRVDAWVQRGDAAPARSRDMHGFDGRQSYFLETARHDVDPAVTINGIATAEHARLHVVGAMRENDCGISHYSAAGPALAPSMRIEAPDVVEAVDASHALPGALVGGARPGSSLRVSGTSIAAAMFSRRLYRLLADGCDPGALRHGAKEIWVTRDPPVTAADPALADPLLRGELRRLPRQARRRKG